MMVGKVSFTPLAISIASSIVPAAEAAARCLGAGENMILSRRFMNSLRSLLSGAATIRYDAEESAEAQEAASEKEEGMKRTMHGLFASIAFLASFGKKRKVGVEAAKALYVAIVGDSGRFLYGATSPLTFAAASWLIGKGIDIRGIYRSMYEKKIEDLEFQKYVLDHYRITPKGVAYYLLPEEGLKELGLTSERGKEHVNMFSNIEGINAWCSITEDNDPKEPCWRISIRSKAKDISGVAQKWGGGGHPQASGAKFKDLSELDSFLSDLDALF